MARLALIRFNNFVGCANGSGRQKMGRQLFGKAAAKGALALVRGHADGVVSTVEDDEVGLEHDVAVDLERRGGGLKTAEAGCRCC